MIPSICEVLLPLFPEILLYFLQIPLITFKREKEVARRLMFDGRWVTEEEDEERGLVDSIMW